MNQSLQSRIAAIKAECEEIIRLEKAVVPHQWSAVPGIRGGLYDSMVVSGGSDPTFVLDGYRDDCVFIAHARNVSPAMARVVVATIKNIEFALNIKGMSGNALEAAVELVNQWDGSK